MIARPEHPKPQFEREGWRNLNGEWDFSFDDGRSGLSRGMNKAGAVYEKKIVVPFCPESKLSGIGDVDFHAAVWYRRSFALSKKDLAGRVLLHFGAVDYKCRVFVNETEVGGHQGGYVSFSLDITDAAKEGENVLVVCCEDDSRDPMIPSG
ncbi:MAG: beta-galactosidase, partial [Clostridia bacterium]|nr:beta-galactosidase [Clostridia bacterium]